MAINDTTTNRSYQLPNPANLLAEDVVRLRAALSAIDADVFARYTKAEVDGLISDLIGGAPAALDTLNELAAALNDDADFAAAVTQGLAVRYTKTEADAIFQTLAGMSSYQTTAGMSAYAQLSVAQSFTKAQRGTVVALTDAATIAVDLSLSNNFSLALGGNRTLGAPTNQVAGQSGAIAITQVGGFTLAYNSAWKFPGGTAPTLTITASAVDVLVYYVESATRITARLIADVK